MIDEYFEGLYTVGICRETGNYLLKTNNNPHEWHKMQFNFVSEKKESSWVCPENEYYFDRAGVFECPACGKYHLCIERENSFFLFTNTGKKFNIEEELAIQREADINRSFALQLATRGDSAWVGHKWSTK